MKTGREGNARQELVGPRSNRGNKIQNGRRVNKGKMQRIMISSVPCGNFVSTKWGVSELEVDSIMFYWGKEAPFGLSFRDFWKKSTGTCTCMPINTCTCKSSFDPELILMFFFIFNILLYPQSAFYPWSAVCILPLVCSLHFTLSLHFTPSLHFTHGLQSTFYPWSAVCILPSVCILPPVCSLQSAFYTDRFVCLFFLQSTTPGQRTEKHSGRKRKATVDGDSPGK